MRGYKKYASIMVLFALFLVSVPAYAQTVFQYTLVQQVKQVLTKGESMSLMCPENGDTVKVYIFGSFTQQGKCSGTDTHYSFGYCDAGTCAVGLFKYRKNTSLTFGYSMGSDGVAQWENQGIVLPFDAEPIYGFTHSYIALYATLSGLFAQSFYRGILMTIMAIMFTTFAADRIMKMAVRMTNETIAENSLPGLDGSRPETWDETPEETAMIDEMTYNIMDRMENYDGQE